MRSSLLSRIVLIIAKAYTFLLVVVPKPRPARPSEKRFVAIQSAGSLSKSEPLPCWFDEYVYRKEFARISGESTADAHTVEPAEILMSVVVPAYNEEKRLGIMLDEALEFLDKAYSGKTSTVRVNGHAANGTASKANLEGWEILIVSDGSKDRTAEVALDFARKHGLSEPAPAKKGSKSQPPSRTLRVITLEENRGKGGAVTHGMRHARGAYVAFADADGASRFHDLGRLVEGCDRVKDSQARAVAIGSRAHMVGSEEVVKVSNAVEAA